MGCSPTTASSLSCTSGEKPHAVWPKMISKMMGICLISNVFCGLFIFESNVLIPPLCLPAILLILFLAAEKSVKKNVP